MTAPDQPTGGRFVGTTHRFPLRIYFEDTDLSGVVYHANYLRYFERARSDMLMVAGVDQRAAQEAGEGHYAVRSMQLDWRAPARLNDALVVVSTVVRVRAAAVDIQQTVIRDDVLLASARVEVAFVGGNGRPRRQPAAWIDVFARLATTGKGA
ncbi:thioesterase [Sphingomonas sp. Leaf407]|uniref:YbgC/FadM family acyl-CoA thioesterase n=1 Tax=unclassified Sphingomonas TaxID=196159 RepID=UPI0006FD3CE1|nr:MULTISPECIES: YbgC/FadM family acyl-CoA thioesterase [unclassified Sphingomonas]KQN40292.1 thioesterase [Sphingomonas sp. Leaf42]KQT29646.1 thioesterase [Sphingomonas sp. Leaf407]